MISGNENIGLRAYKILGVLMIAVASSCGGHSETNPLAPVPDAREWLLLTTPACVRLGFLNAVLCYFQDKENGKQMATEDIMQMIIVETAGFAPRDVRETAAGDGLVLTYDISGGPTRVHG